MSSIKSKGNPAEILLKAVELNKLSYKDLMSITGKPERTVFKWLAKESKPDPYTLYKISTALNSAKMKIPKELKRFCANELNSAISWGQSSNKELFRTKNGAILYVYKDKNITALDLSKEIGVCKDTIYIKLRNISPGSDVTKIVDSINPKKPAITFIFEGSLLSVSDTSKTTKYTVESIYARLKNIPSGQNVTSIINRMGVRKTYVFKNKNLTVLEISLEVGVSKGSVYARVKGNEYGSDVTNLMNKFRVYNENPTLSSLYVYDGNMLTVTNIAKIIMTLKW